MHEQKGLGLVITRCTESHRCTLKLMADVLLKTNGCGISVRRRVRSPLFTLLKSKVKALVNIQYLSYLHQDLDFSCSLMQFKDLHSCAELPWKQSSPGCFFFSSVTGDTADQSSESSEARQEALRCTLSTEKSC